MTSFSTAKKFLLASAIFLMAAGFGTVSVQAQLLGPGFSGFQGGDPYNGGSPSNGNGPSTQVTTPTISTVKRGDSSPSATTSTGGYCQGSLPSISTGDTKLPDIFKFITCGIQRLIVPTLMALGGLLFIIGVVKFITSSQSEERNEGRQFMIWGIVGFAVVFSVWGILAIFNQTFGLNNAAPTVPTTNVPTIKN